MISAIVASAVCASPVFTTLTTPVSDFVHGYRFSYTIPASWHVMEKMHTDPDVPSIRYWDKAGATVVIAQKGQRIQITVSTTATTRAERHDSYNGVFQQFGPGVRGVVRERELRERTAKGYRAYISRWLHAPVPGQYNKTVQVEVIFDSNTKAQRQAGRALSDAVFHSLRIIKPQ